MKFTFTAALTTAILAITTPARATDSFNLFGNSPSGTQILILDGGMNVSATQTGWFDSNGQHGGGGLNYFTGYNGTEKRSFFTFNVFSGISSASVSIGQGLADGFYSSTGEPITFTLYDVSSFIDTNVTYIGKTKIFTDLGNGTVFGSTIVSGPTSAVVVNFNAAGVAAINAAFTSSTPFTFGGRAFLAGAPLLPEPPAVPEPASWAMMISGFGLVGAAMRRRVGAPAA